MSGAANSFFNPAGAAGCRTRIRGQHHARPATAAPSDPASRDRARRCSQPPAQPVQGQALHHGAQRNSWPRPEHQPGGDGPRRAAQHNNVERATKNGISGTRSCRSKSRSAKGIRSSSTKTSISAGHHPGPSSGKLPPAFVPEIGRYGGQLQGINDGAAAILIMSADKAKEFGHPAFSPDQSGRPGRLPTVRHGPLAVRPSST